MDLDAVTEAPTRAVGGSELLEVPLRRFSNKMEKWSTLLPLRFSMGTMLIGWRSLAKP
jgi:hypothetical protein